MNNGAKFDVLRKDDHMIVIRDVGHDKGFMSVTNDADGVIRNLSPAFDQRVLYYDSMNDLCELVHDGSRFLAYAMASESRDLNNLP